jgi:flagellar hook-length control protein FliK
MHTTTLPIQGANAGATPQRATGIANTDNGEFRAALAREVEQRHESAPPAPPPKPAAAQPQADQNTAAEPAPPAPQAAGPADAKPEPKAGKSSDADQDKPDADTAAEHPAAAQVTDMLALAASLKPHAPRLDGAAPKAAAGALASARDAHAAQLGALQGAYKALAKGEAPAGKDGAALDQLHNPAAAALGVDSKAGRDAFAAQLKLHPEAAPARDALAEVAALKEPAPAPLAPAAAAVFEAAQAAAAPADRIAARVGTAAWDQQVGQKIVWMVAGEEQSASLTLNPPDLGPLQVVLSVTNDQASVTFSSSQQEVRQALENALPRLREMMGENGIALGNATVDAGMPDGRQAQGGEQPRAGGTAARFDSRAPLADSAPRTGARVTTLGERGMVDTFA